MNYEINWQKTGNMFAVPHKLISSITIFDESSLKIALYIFSHPTTADITTLGNELNLTKKQVLEGLQFLEKHGVIILSDHAPKKALKTPLKLNKDEFNQIVDKEEAVKFLLDKSQQLLGRTTTYSEANTLVTLYLFYGLDIDVILMIITYCLSLKKDNINYIQKVAIDWANKGITNHEAAEEHLQNLQVQNECEKTIKQLFGITGRSLTQKEKQFSANWLHEYQFDLNLVVEAFERCVEHTGKVSFPYINKILTSWQKKGYTTLLDVQTGEDTQLKLTAMQEKSYDLNDLENILNQSPIYDKGAAVK